MNQYEELVQRLEQIVKTMNRIVSTQEENVKRLGEQVDILAEIVWLEKPKKVEKRLDIIPKLCYNKYNKSRRTPQC